MFWLINYSLTCSFKILVIETKESEQLCIGTRRRVPEDQLNIFTKNEGDTNFSIAIELAC